MEYILTSIFSSLTRIYAVKCNIVVFYYFFKSVWSLWIASYGNLSQIIVKLFSTTRSISIKRQFFQKFHQNNKLSSILFLLRVVFFLFVIFTTDLTISSITEFTQCNDHHTLYYAVQEHSALRLNTFIHFLRALTRNYSFNAKILHIPLSEILSEFFFLTLNACFLAALRRQIWISYEAPISLFLKKRIEN